MNQYDLETMLKLCKEMYGNNSSKSVIQGLQGISNADNKPEPIILNGVNWEGVKRK